jgi:hypothetical protein
LTSNKECLSTDCPTDALTCELWGNSTLPFQHAISNSKVHSALQARDLLFVHRIDIRRDTVFPLGHLRRDLNVLGQLHGTLLQRTAQVDIPDLVAEVGLLLDKRDKAIFDLQEDLGAGLDVFGEGAGRGDGEVGAWRWWVGVEVDVLDVQDVVAGVGAVLGGGC